MRKPTGGAWCLLVTVVALSGCDSPGYGEKPRAPSWDEVVRQSLRMLEAADPVRDVEQAIREGDLRFIGMMGYALIVPGVDDYGQRIWDTNGVRVIKGTSDFIANDDVARLNELAYEYAKRYNMLLLDYLLKRP